MGCTGCGKKTVQVVTKKGEVRKVQDSVFTEILTANGTKQKIKVYKK